MDVSVLIATSNRAPLLTRTLEALSRLQVDGLEWEVIVVDNGSVDGTPSVLEEARGNLPLRPLWQSTPNKSRALNCALNVAKGGLVVFTDDDVIPDPGWLKAYLGASGRWPRDAVFCGRIEPLFPLGTPEWMMAADFERACVCFSAFHPAHEEMPVEESPVGPNFAMLRHVIAGSRFDETVGPRGGSYSMGEDTRFVRQVKNRGHRVIYVPTARLQHVVRPDMVTTHGLFRRAEMAGRAWARENQLEDCAYVLGAPRWLWRQTVEAWIGHVLNRPRDELERFRTGWEWHFLCGALKEHRQISLGSTFSTLSDRG